MRVIRDYGRWDPDDPLDREAESVLAFLEQGTLRHVDEVVARIDEYGTVYVNVPVGAASLYLQAGDGWDRVIWTTPSRRAYEWQWDVVRGPGQVSALVDGRGVERLSYWGRRCVGSELVCDGETLASRGGLLWPVLRRLGVASAQREVPVLSPRR